VAQHKAVAIKTLVTTNHFSPQALVARAQSPFSSPTVVLYVS